MHETTRIASQLQQQLQHLTSQGRAPSSGQSLPESEARGVPMQQDFAQQPMSQEDAQADATSRLLDVTSGSTLHAVPARPPVLEAVELAPWGQWNERDIGKPSFTSRAAARVLSAARHRQLPVGSSSGRPASACSSSRGRASPRTPRRSGQATQGKPRTRARSAPPGGWRVANGPLGTAAVAAVAAAVAGAAGLAVVPQQLMRPSSRERNGGRSRQSASPRNGRPASSAGVTRAVARMERALRKEVCAMSLSSTWVASPSHALKRPAPCSVFSSCTTSNPTQDSLTQPRDQL